MTDRQDDKDVPTLEDELFALGSEGADRGRAEPIIRTPAVPPWERLAKVDRGDLVRFAAGFATFAFIDLVMMYGPLMGRGDSGMPQFVALLVLAFGLGGMFAWHVRGAWRPYGLGMMGGWVALTLLSAGFLTGLMG
ncbi:MULTISPECIES: hypothetical protein [Thermomonospora]|uniref:Uncharacterized protein n=1 Tax=Thermomonospora curvata (strain ATCC 19995 / DSM 43183 / JCM 3096 / KCTC 9072 / NBRC 15933 / NCIMB 10081 / Henssen B9) TaxID=471852 RepID=D1AEC6_THECD|nr:MULTISPECIES: hypothetical protein [Thermomonospora]ACY95742.1 hypothetical protein Tcur_0135 [Thermomonospora curvata DSM 43183]PKK16326.1 MAG: hypothetical protein BUE48_000670 [Thermomonospora sp. CIF 1]